MPARRRRLDHYRRWESDLDLMQSLGLGSYRFSIAWPRLVRKSADASTARPWLLRPSRRCRACARYHACGDTVPLGPASVHLDVGGWENRDSAGWFADYAAVVFAGLGDRVGPWLTINETRVIAQQGYMYGRWRRASRTRGQRAR